MKVHRWVTAVVVGAAITLGPTVAASAPATTATGAAPRVGHHGRWFTDADGRVLIFHGGNVVAKAAPYAPSDFGFDDADIAEAQSLGFTAVRLGVMWAGVEPKPGVFDEAYLDRIAATQQALWRHGIYSMLDSHQDFYNQRYGGGGDGAPDWAVIDPSTAPDPASVTGTRAWQSFWDDAKAPDGVGLQEHFTAMWHHVARRFAPLPGVVGIDMINEPPAGSPSGLPTGPGLGGTDGQISCLKPVLGCPEFDTEVLAPFYRKVIAAIRPVDPRVIINYEPNGTYQFGVIPSFIPNLGDANVAFSYHPYVSHTSSQINGSVGAQAPGVLPAGAGATAQGVADRNDAPAWIGEIGAAFPTGDIGDADLSMQGYLYWTYWSTDNADGGTDSSATIKDPRQPPTGSNLNTQSITDYVRPYPEVTAGTPIGWSYDASSKAFTFTYSTRQPDGELGTKDTEVYLPSTAYPDGFTAKVTGAVVQATSLSGQVLHLRAPCSTTASTVTLTVSAGGAAPTAHPIADCPQSARTATTPAAKKAGRSTVSTAALRAPAGSLAATGLPLAAEVLAGVLLVAAAVTRRGTR